MSLFFSLALIPLHSWIFAALVLLAALVNYLLTPPAELRHLPRLPIAPLLWSYARGEVDDARIKRLIVPFVREADEGLVLVYAFGRWIVHVVDHKVGLLLYLSCQLIMLHRL